jgi:hypothetical protein
MPDEVLKYLRRITRRILVRRIIESAGLGVIVGGLASACVQLLLWMVGTPGAAVGIIILAGSILGGAAVALLKGVSLRYTARYVDNHAFLDERLTTAVELADAGDRTPAAQCVYAQAGDAVRSPEVAAVRFWVRGRVTGAGAILAVLLCGSLMLLPQARSADERILDALAQMSPEAVRALAGEFARAAEAADSEAPLLARAAKATEQKDVRSLAAILADLKRRGVKLVRVVRADVLARATAGGTEGDGAARTRPAAPVFRRPSVGAGGAVHVWDPLYDKFNPGIRSTTEPADVDDPPSAVSYGNAWSSARLRAAGALRRGEIRSEYRQMVREFFSERR